MPFVHRLPVYPSVVGSIIREKVATYIIFIDVNDGMILGVSENCFKKFGIPSKFVYGFAYGFESPHRVLGVVE